MNTTIRVDTEQINIEASRKDRIGADLCSIRDGIDVACRGVYNIYDWQMKKPADEASYMVRSQMNVLIGELAKLSEFLRRYADKVEQVDFQVITGLGDLAFSLEMERSAALLGHLQKAKIRNISANDVDCRDEEGAVVMVDGATLSIPNGEEVFIVYNELFEPVLKIIGGREVEEIEDGKLVKKIIGGLTLVLVEWRGQRYYVRFYDAYHGHPIVVPVSNPGNTIRPELGNGAKTRQGDDNWCINNQYIDLRNYEMEGFEYKPGINHSTALCGFFALFHALEIQGSDGLKRAFQTIWSVDGRDPATSILRNNSLTSWNNLITFAKLFGAQAEWHSVNGNTSPSQLLSYLGPNNKLIVLVGEDSNSGNRIAPGAGGHWVTVDNFLERDGRIWVEVFDPIDNSYKQYDWEAFNAGMQAPKGCNTGGFIVLTMPRDNS